MIPYEWIESGNNKAGGTHCGKKQTHHSTPVPESTQCEKRNTWKWNKRLSSSWPWSWQSTLWLDVFSLGTHHYFGIYFRMCIIGGINHATFLIHSILSARMLSPISICTAVVFVELTLGFFSPANCVCVRACDFRLLSFQSQFILGPRMMCCSYSLSNLSMLNQSRPSLPTRNL